MLSNERDDIKLGVAGFSIGAAMALYCGTRRALGQYGNGIRSPINLSAIMAISGWLPSSRVHTSQETIRRASLLHILLCHGQDHFQWSCEESCLDLLLHVKPCGDRVRTFGIECLLKNSVQSDSLKLPLTLPCQRMIAVTSVARNAESYEKLHSDMEFGDHFLGAFKANEEAFVQYLPAAIEQYLTNYKQSGT